MAGIETNSRNVPRKSFNFLNGLEIFFFTELKQKKTVAMNAPKNGQFMLPYSVPVDDRHVHKYQLDMSKFKNNLITQPKYNEVRSALTTETVSGKPLIQAWREQVQLKAPRPDNHSPAPVTKAPVATPSYEFSWDGFQEVLNDVPKSLWVLFAVLIFMVMIFSIRSTPDAPKTIAVQASQASKTTGGFETLIIPDTD